MKQHSFFGWRAGLALIAAMMTASAGAEVPGDAADPVLVKTAKVEVRKSDYDAALLALIPDEKRETFVENNQNVIKFLAELLRNKTQAAQAQAAGLDKTKNGEAVIKTDTMMMYAQLQRVQDNKEAEKAFAAKEADYEARAREIYTVDKKNYVKPEEIKASHILFSAKKYKEGEGLQRAMEVRQQLLAGADFSTLLKQEEENEEYRKLSDLGWFTADKMVPEFSKVAFALKKEGEISEPVKTAFGWHLIRLEGRKAAEQMSYDEAKPIIMGNLKQKFLTDQRQKVAFSIDNDPSATLNKEAIDALLANPLGSDAAAEQLKKTLNEK